MKTMAGWVGALVVTMVVGCAASEDDEQTQGAAANQTAAEQKAPEGCFSVRDDKTYPVGTKLVGKHDERRCPPGFRVCLAPDSNYGSECQNDGTWFIKNSGSFAEPAF